MKSPVLLMSVFTFIFSSSCTYKSMQRFILKYDHLITKIGQMPEVANYERDLVWASLSGEELTLDVSWPEG